MYPITVHGLVFLSNHYHLLLSVPDAQRLASFMNYFNGNLAREAGRLANWREKFWSRRYQAIPVSDEPAAQIARLEYILAHGVKEGLVSDPADWSGVHCADALISGREFKGVWIDRTKSYKAKMAGERVSHRDFESHQAFYLSPLPCWAHLHEETYQSRVVEMIDRIKARHKEQKKGLHRQSSPDERPQRSKRLAAPLFHCASRKVRRELLDAYRWFVGAFREASAKLSRGDPEPGFPRGSFPPQAPFVFAA